MHCKTFYEHTTLTLDQYICSCVLYLMKSSQLIVLLFYEFNTFCKSMVYSEFMMAINVSQLFLVVLKSVLLVALYFSRMW